MQFFRRRGLASTWKFHSIERRRATRRRPRRSSGGECKRSEKCMERRMRAACGTLGVNWDGARWRRGVNLYRIRFVCMTSPIVRLAEEYFRAITNRQKRLFLLSVRLFVLIIHCPSISFYCSIKRLSFASDRKKMWNNYARIRQRRTLLVHYIRVFLLMFEFA